jgi:hypothetical protein
VTQSTANRTLRNFLLALVLLGAAPINQVSADGIVKVRLTSADTMIDVEGTATLQGQELQGHLVGNGSDVVLTGIVKNHSVSVDVVGKIVPNCLSPRQFMGAIDVNDGASTSIVLTFHCDGKGGGSGEEYQFRLDLLLPAQPLYAPPPSNSGESANLE